MPSFSVGGLYLHLWRQWNETTLGIDEAFRYGQSLYQVSRKYTTKILAIYASYDLTQRVLLLER
jgi:hypothetical protein